MPGPREIFLKQLRTGYGGVILPMVRNMRGQSYLDTCNYKSSSKPLHRTQACDREQACSGSLRLQCQHQQKQ